MPDIDTSVKCMQSHVCDIVLPIYNGLEYVKECISSILSCTSIELFHLYLINDCSDSVTSDYLREQSKKYANISLIENEENLGFLKSCNKGINITESEYVLLINSDVVVVDKWLDRMLNCITSDPYIASVNPITNSASQIEIPMSPGFNYLTMDKMIHQKTKKNYPDVVTGVGYCMLLRRSALNEVGLFDEIYGHGYCEESDLCMRFTTNGYRTVVADDVYVFHKGSASFTNRDERYLHNRKIFDSRWRDEYIEQYSIFKKNDPLSYLRKELAAPQRWAPKTSMRESYRRIRAYYRKGNYISALKTSMKGVLELPRYTQNLMTEEYISSLPSDGRLRVTYVIHNLTIAGGVLSVVQLVNELILLGIDARIVTLYQYPEITDWKFYFSPIVYRSQVELIEKFPESDIVVATHWSTASWVYEIMKNGKARHSAYFLQDYESWFFPETDFESRQKVISTYSMIPNKIVKSSWLQGMIENDGFKSKKIWLGMDLGIFYPRDVPKRNNPTVLAMARPGTARRGFDVLIEALSNIKNRIADIDIILFGEDLSTKKIPFDYEDHGVVSERSKLAELYSSADIFIDASDFQGFGRTALEAMACGTACVLTDVGGVNEYAIQDVNCVLVSPKNPGQIVDAVCTLIEDEALRAKYVESGKKTASKFSHKIEAKRTYEYFMRLSDGVE